MRTKGLSIALLCFCVAAPAVATDLFSSVTQLSAAQEVQDNPVESDGSGSAIVAFSADFSSFGVFVNFNDLVGSEVTRLHFHCAGAGANGPVAIGIIDRLSPGNDNSQVVTESGNSLFGELTNANFPEDNGCTDVIGQPINNVVSLAAAIDAGLVYWNLHTDAFPAGELRGQVRPLDKGLRLGSINDHQVADDQPQAPAAPVDGLFDLDRR